LFSQLNCGRHKGFALSAPFGIHWAGMKFKKKAAFLGVIALLALLFALPVTRAELDWYWTEWQDQTANYLQYATDWPKGRHTIEARLRYEQRAWNDTKRAMINEALKKVAAAKSDPEAAKERRVRKERFFWKGATVENTVISYQDYLRRYPNGEFADQARRRIDDLTRQPEGGSATTDSTNH
jgi:hypothetical protein